jgi:hypothetical protein
VDAAGGVTVVYGSVEGLGPDGSTTFSEGGGAGDGAETGDRFGSAVALADFDDDGYDDVTVGTPVKM